ncbi:hypothetical protein Pyn_17110 [Prunus yedoensis var. nudiflora]|uniref:Uncharacterized protein n=1 Tax=Prunus yedoensis var. nudiflora TaxID=2094558 RepID=A0A314V1D7_PRUYE|nr:hypothetical protein Pyn_17110 [Prunus yedoensis var. nudiflora]
MKTPSLRLEAVKITYPERAKATKYVVLDNSNFEANVGLLNPPNDNTVGQELARSSPCGVNIISPLANDMSSLEGHKKSIFDIFGSEAKNFRNEVNVQCLANVRIVEEGTRVRDLIRRHDDCLISKRIKDAKTSLEKLNKLDEELCESHIGEKELLKIEHIEASCKSQEAEIQKLIDSLVPFCNKS